MRLLFVCTGNICRSPLAERLAMLWAEQALGAAAATIHIRSAGTEACEGRAMEKRSAAALVALGGDPTGFVARTFTPWMADQADLVLTMTRRHRRTVLSNAPRALRHTFTLPEAAALLESADTEGLTSLPLSRRASEVASRLNAGRAWRRGKDADDVFDPMGESANVHSQVAARIARKLEPLSDILFADERSGGSWGPAPVPLRRPAVPPVPARTR